MLQIITNPIGFEAVLPFSADFSTPLLRLLSALRLQLGVLCNFTGLAFSFRSREFPFPVNSLREEKGLWGTLGLVSVESFLTLKDCDRDNVAEGPDGSGLVDFLREGLLCKSLFLLLRPLLDGVGWCGSGSGTWC